MLLVDDEEDILETLRRLLEDDYDLVLATSGAEALETLKKNPDTVVIMSDQRMPGMTGTEMLAKSQAIVPDAIRIILTGYTDIKNLIDAINKGHVYQYITKPFEFAEINVALKRGIEYYEQKKQLEVAYQDLKETYEQLKNTQEHLVRMAKMSVLGTLMGGVAHEIRNPISSLKNAAELMRLECVDIEQMLNNLGSQKGEILKKLGTNFDVDASANTVGELSRIIESSTDLINEIVEDLRGFSRLDNEKFVLSDLHKYIDRAINLIKSKYKYKVNIKKSFAENLPETMAVPGPIVQVLLNILNNACQAIEENGAVWIKTFEKDGNIMISLRDNGNGIPPGVLKNIFDPGFTTKPEDEGTGLGLSISYAIIKKHEGDITVSSEPGKGSEFVISIPIRTSLSDGQAKSESKKGAK